MHEVLLLLSAPIGSFSEYPFNFPFWFFCYDVRWWFQEVRAMLVGFTIRCEKRCMEDIVYLPMGRQQ
jgi:hypothetical protein